jgi:hypothetical protein
MQGYFAGDIGYAVQGHGYRVLAGVVVVYVGYSPADMQGYFAGDIGYAVQGTI